jgi:hypothetical protein
MLNPIANLHDRPLRIVTTVVHEAVYTILQLLLLALVLLGIGGVAFSALSAEGWLLEALRGAWRHNPIFALLVIGAAVLGGSWLKRVVEQRLERVDYIGDMLIYGWIVLGAYFSARLIITGSL